MAKKKDQGSAFLIFLIILIVLALFIIKPYIGTLILAYVTALFLFPVYSKIVNKLELPSWVAILATLIIFIVAIAIPFALVITITAKSLQHFVVDFNSYYNEFSVDEVITALNNTLYQIPYIDVHLDSDNIANLIQSFTEIILGTLTNILINIAPTTIAFFLSLVIYLISLFYLIPKFNVIENEAEKMFPFRPETTKLYFDRTNSIIKDSIKSTIILAFVQASVAALMMGILGIRAVGILFIFMIIFSVIPYLGTGLVTIPVAIIMIISGDVTGGIILLLWQLFVVGTIDNILRPKLISKDSNIDPLLLFLLLLGGMAAFGIMGIFYAPIIAALLKASLDIYREEKAQEHKK